MKGNHGYAAALLMLFSMTAAAAPEFPFSPQGTPAGGPGMAMPSAPDPRCVMSASQRDIDYGLMSRGQLTTLPGGQFTPGTRNITLTIICPFPQKMILRAEGESVGQGLLRYGDHGYVQVRVADAQMDNHAVTLEPVTPDGQLTESSGQQAQFTADQHVGAVYQGRLAEGKISRSGWRSGRSCRTRMCGSGS